MPLWSEGMFLDGLTYASISRNLSEGLGSFWTPHYTDTLFAEFYEHPPLALWLQSILFYLFDDSIYVERIYDLFTFVITGYIIQRIWFSITRDDSFGWLPLLFFVLIPLTWWSVANNILENTMMPFLCMAVLYIIKYDHDGRVLHMVIAGGAVFLAFLSKGVFALYLWVLPMCFFLADRKHISNRIIQTFTLIMTTLIPLVILMLLSASARMNILSYVENQVIGSVEHVINVDSRFYILGKFLEYIMPATLIATWTYIKSRKQSSTEENPYTHTAFALMMLSIAGVLPIMISMKQSEFYILTVFPFFAVGLALLIYPYVRFWCRKYMNDSLYTGYLQKTVYILFGLCIVLSLTQFDRIGRDHSLIEDVVLIIDEVGEDETVALCPRMEYEWKLFAYLARYGNVSCDLASEDHHYYIESDDCEENASDQWIFVKHLNNYKIFKRSE